MSTQPTELQNMLAGELYLAYDPALVAARRKARALCRAFNQTTEEQPAERDRLLRELCGRVGSHPEIEPPFFCDYGSNIFLGDRVFMNFDCVLLDCNRITIGDRTLIGPGVHIYAATHPIEAETRAAGREYAFPVTIGNNVWIGGGSIVCPRVEIGDGAVIGAGSVVTRSIPPRCLAVGNPCRVVRELPRP